MTLHLPKEVAKIFFAALQDGILLKAGFQDAKKRKSISRDDAFFKHASRLESIRTQLLRNSRFSDTYPDGLGHLHKKTKDAGSHDYTPIDDILFCNCLEFIDGVVRPGTDTDRDTYDEKRLNWGSKFLKKHCPDFPESEYPKILEGKGKKGKGTRTLTTNDRIKKIATTEDAKVAKSLVGKIFISEYKQGQLTDRTVFRIKGSDKAEIWGEWEIIYQEPNLDYREETMILLVEGIIHYGNVLTLTFKNKTIRDHAGVYLAKIGKWEEEILGQYIVHYPDRPDIRETSISDHNLKLCRDEKYATEFINELKGKKANKEDARRFIEDWERRYSITKELQPFIEDWKKFGKYEQEITDFIIKCNETKILGRKGGSS